MCGPNDAPSVPASYTSRGERICKTLLAVDKILTAHVDGEVEDLREHVMQLRNLQMEVAALIRDLGIRR